MPRIYLDNAATSWPKPEAVYRAVDAHQREVGASYGRGSYASAQSSARVVDATRRAVATLLGESDPTRVVFASSGTDALAIAIHGLVRPGDHVVTTVVEHNAVLRPLAAVRAEVSFIGCDPSGRVDAEEVCHAVRPDTAHVVVSHASNVTGAVQPVEAIAAGLADHPALLLVDAAQTLGRWPVDVASLGADLIAAPGHKGLLGPLGTGVLWIREGVEARLPPLRYGGTGTNSASLEMPLTMPSRYEAGSLNVPGIAGLGAGAEHLLSVGVSAEGERVRSTTRQLRDRLAEVDGLRFVGDRNDDHNAGVVTFNLRGYDPHDLAAGLSMLAGVECRAGLHCSPKVHEAFGTSPSGSVRFSPGAMTTAAEVDAAVHAVGQLAANPLA